METSGGYDFIKAAVGEVTYTVEHRQSATDDEWRHFRTAVHFAFWRLPAMLKPRSPRYTVPGSADELFDGHSLVFAFAPHRLVSIDPFRSADTLSLQEINTGHAPGDFFCRVVLILLKTFCPSHSQIHSSAGESSWLLPLSWLNRQFGGSDIAFVAPEQLHRRGHCPKMAGAAHALMLRMLSTPHQLVEPEDWWLLTALEHHL